MIKDKTCCGEEWVFEEKPGMHFEHCIFLGVFRNI